MSRYVKTNELYHHGIKGQKWGVRRFQKKDGTLTNEGKKRYNESESSNKKTKEYKIPNNKSYHRLKLEDKYKSQGMSSKEAEQAAARRIRAEQYVVAASAVTVTACIAYNKHKNYTTDKILKDTSFQRIMSLGEDDVIRDGRQYLAFDKKDKLKYQGMLGWNFNNNNDGKKVYNVTVKAKQDVKIASPKRAKDTFAKLYKEDEEFKKSVDSALKNGGRFNKKFKGISKKLNDGTSLTDRDIKGKAYDAFNIFLVDQESKDGVTRSTKFYDALKKQGVNAVYDVNDQKYSGYKAKAPIITFDGSFDYSKREMGKDELSARFGDAMMETMKPAMIKKGAAFVASLAVGKYVQNSNVYKYRMEHPDTDLTDKEIVELLKKK